QYQAARDFWLALPDDDILCGYRRAAKLPAPGKPLGGWCDANSDIVFGQWLSGMARMHRATGDAEIMAKAVKLMTEWAKTLPADANTGMNHYAWDKLVCGLVDLKHYAGVDDALPLLERICDWGAAKLAHQNVPGSEGRSTGNPAEWYTLAENLYRAYQLTGKDQYKDFADRWLYTPYWSKFLDTADPKDAFGVHAYSHVNTWSSCAMAYAATGDEKFLRMLRNAYDFLQKRQCFATGGFGPSEFLATSDGGLGRSIETRFDTFETGCGSWAAFKMTRYLISFTGEARYGDWTERIFYNGIGAALPVTAAGRNFYYSDYRLASAMKTYNWDPWACCSGTYIQAVADYHNIIYYHDAGALYVNLFVPSQVTWKRDGGDVKLTQQTQYPAAETTTFTINAAGTGTFGLRFRVPAWTSGVNVKINGAAAAVECKPGAWAAIDRTWKSGDAVEVTIPMKLRMVPIDEQHPDRIAVMHGPVALVLEQAYDDPFVFPQTEEELNAWAKPDNGMGPQSARGVKSPYPIPGAFGLHPPESAFVPPYPPGAPPSRVHSLLRPFYTVEENYPYKIYFDRKARPVVYW
ncbi:MAG TPA: beta-L-arabinofuranosidase domain-containing protein, partial [Phycisphaerae bacterium]|nr:beta-L-arabinofuranosidase domain-containing protein [Phycisphaerae bacterium]